MTKKPPKLIVGRDGNLKGRVVGTPKYSAPPAPGGGPESGTRDATPDEVAAPREPTKPRIADSFKRNKNRKADWSTPDGPDPRWSSPFDGDGSIT